MPADNPVLKGFQCSKFGLMCNSRKLLCQVILNAVDTTHVLMSHSIALSHIPSHACHGIDIMHCVSHQQTVKNFTPDTTKMFMQHINTLTPVDVMPHIKEFTPLDFMQDVETTDTQVRM